MDLVYKKIDINHLKDLYDLNQEDFYNRDIVEDLIILV